MIQPTKHEQTKENANQPPSFVVSAKSMFQLFSTGDIIGRVPSYISIVFFVDIVVLSLQYNNVKNSFTWVFLCQWLILFHIFQCVIKKN